jgi:hypothetical protein
VSLSAWRLSAIIDDCGSQDAIETATTLPYRFLAAQGGHIPDRFFGRLGSVGYNLSFQPLSVQWRPVLRYARGFHQSIYFLTIRSEGHTLLRDLLHLLGLFASRERINSWYWRGGRESKSPSGGYILATRYHNLGEPHNSDVRRGGGAVSILNFALYFRVSRIAMAMHH